MEDRAEPGEGMSREILRILWRIEWSLRRDVKGHSENSMDAQSER